jgi:acyl-CoA hydrolase
MAMSLDQIGPLAKDVKTAALLLEAVAGHDHRDETSLVLGEKFYSGVGGQADFNRGAGRAPGGRAIIALPSTAKDGKISRIVTHLTEGAGVVTTRAGVHYVVTEYGVAYLHGKSIKERALALLSIAHPNFRPKLLREAVESKFLPAELLDKETKLVAGPRDLRTTMLLKD